MRPKNETVIQVVRLAVQLGIGTLLIISMLSCSKDGTEDVSETFSIAGSLSFPNSIVLDADLAFNPLSNTNNAHDDAQPFTHTSKVYGFLSHQEGNYLSINQERGVFYPKDEIDIFHTELLENDIFHIRFSFPEPYQIRVNSDRPFIRVSIVSAETPEISENIDIKVSDLLDGAYSFSTRHVGSSLIELQTLADNPNPIIYQLKFEGLTATQTVRGLNFVDNELIVKFKRDPKKRSLKDVRRSLSNTNLIQMINLSSDDKGDVFLLGYKDTQARSSKRNSDANHLDASHLNKVRVLQQLRKLKERTDVIYAEPNYLRKIQTADPQLPQQWNLSAIKAPQAWETTQGEGTVIAVIDSGIDLNHDDLSFNILKDSSIDFISSIENAGDGDGLDFDVSDEGRVSHGTHVSGILAAVANNQFGISGVAPQAKLMVLRVIGVNGFARDSDIIQAIKYASGEENLSGLLPEKNADLINLSLGSTDFSSALRDSINIALAKGIVIVAAAGNNSNDDPFYPAAFSGVVSVGALKSTNTKSSFSNYGNWVNLVAPGGERRERDKSYIIENESILSTLSGNQFGYLNGTSMAAPHVTAALALFKQQGQTMNYQNVLDAINERLITTLIIDDHFPQGIGLIDIEKLLSWSGSGIGDNIYTHPMSVNFTQSGKGTFILRETGTVDLSMVNLSLQDERFILTELEADETNFRSFEVNFNDQSDTDMANEINTQILLSYNQSGLAIEKSLPVRLSLDESTTSSDAADIHVTLTKVSDDGADGFVYANTRTSFTEGTYTFLFSGIRPGQYYLEASTDFDGDNVVGESNELIGSYPVLAAKSIITVENKDLEGLDFDIVARDID